MVTTKFKKQKFKGRKQGYLVKIMLLYWEKCTFQQEINRTSKSEEMHSAASPLNSPSTYHFALAAYLIHITIQRIRSVCIWQGWGGKIMHLQDVHEKFSALSDDLITLLYNLCLFTMVYFLNLAF